MNDRRAGVFQTSGQNDFGPGRLLTTRCRAESSPLSIPICRSESRTGVALTFPASGISNISPVSHSYKNQRRLLYIPVGFSKMICVILLLSIVLNRALSIESRTPSHFKAKRKCPDNESSGLCLGVNNCHSAVDFGECLSAMAAS